MKLIFLLLITYLGYFVLKSIAMKNRVGRPDGHGNTSAPDYSATTKHERTGTGKRPTAKPDSVDSGEEMVLDPVCSSYVPISCAIKKGAGSSTVYFCSEECRDKHQA